MSMAQELNAAKINATRQIDDQLMKLNGYLNELNNVIAECETALSGSELDSASTIITHLKETKTKVEKSINMLRTAKDKLFQIRM